jgi:hypothetical protein
MKNEPQIKKLVLRRETLRDLTAQNAGEVKGGPQFSVGNHCRTYGASCYCTTVKACTYTHGQACHYTHGKPCH